LLDAVGKVRHLQPFVSLRTKILTPKMFGEHFALVPIHTKLLSYHGASFPVRPDLNQPNSRRIIPTAGIYDSGMIPMESRM